MKRTATYLLLVTSSLMILPEVKAGSSADPVIDKCVLIETLVGKGSGLLYRIPNGNLFVITCRHVVEDGYCMIIKDVNGRIFEPSINSAEQADVYFSKDRDMALIHVVEPDYENLRWFDQSTKVDSLSIGQSITCYGDSQGQGVVVTSSGKILGVGPINFEIDADIVPGNSGGPILLSESGKVAGVASFASRDTEMWNRGTRFDNAIRRFGIRFDTIDWNNLSNNFTFYGHLLSPTNYVCIALRASYYKSKGDLERACLGYHFGKQHGDALCAACYDELFLNPSFSQYDPQKGIRLLKEDARSGNQYAMCSLGEYYEQRHDYQSSLYWYQKSADLGGIAWAATKVGEFYETGLGTSVDGKRAFEYYSSALNSSRIWNSAALKVGSFLEEGKYVQKDETRAYEMYLEIASRTASGIDREGMLLVCEARYRLARMLQDGRGCQKNIEEAKNWLEKSHALGDPSGQAAYALALLVEQETGSIDVDLLDEAVRKGYQDAIKRKNRRIVVAKERSRKDVQEIKTENGTTRAPPTRSKYPLNEFVSAGKTVSIDLGGGVKLEMVYCPGVATNFWMGKFEVTQEQWQKVMGKNPSAYINPKRPVERITWNECQVFVKKLNELSRRQSHGLKFRLPDATEWAKACRSGAPKEAAYCKLKDGTQITAATLSRVACYMTGGPAFVGSFEPNAWGLYDMHGNVSEWTDSSDRHNRDERICCGGDFYGVSDLCTAGIQGSLPPDKCNKTVGVRLAATGKAQD